MNNLESKVVSLELAERMEKLGWEQYESYFIWLRNIRNFLIRNKYKYDWRVVNRDYKCHQENNEWYDAPLFCEIWKELPDEIQEPESGDYLTKALYEDNSIAYTQSPSIPPPICKITLTNKSDFIQENAGELWCWLRENGYIKEV